MDTIVRLNQAIYWPNFITRRRNEMKQKCICMGYQHCTFTCFQFQVCASFLYLVIVIIILKTKEYNKIQQNEILITAVCFNLFMLCYQMLLYNTTYLGKFNKNKKALNYF
jgi:hypothetical protein